jgi:uncharacterized protein (DUF1499 family)
MTRPDLGVSNNQLTPCPESPNCVSSQATDEEHYIDPIQFSGSQKEAMARLASILETEKRVKIITSTENYVRAEFTSLIFRFVDDVEFYIPDQAPETSVMHVRSASRVGYSDFGVNRKRIEKIRRQL